MTQEKRHLTAQRSTGHNCAFFASCGALETAYYIRDVIDVYRGTCSVQQNPLYLGLYIAFFPQLIAGPIIKYKDIEDQLLSRQKTLEKTAEGIRRFLYGLGKKVLIANVLAGAVDSLYAVEIAQITGAMAWIMSVLYTLQIYYAGQ